MLRVYRRFASSTGWSPRFEVGCHVNGYAVRFGGIMTAVNVLR